MPAEHHGQTQVIAPGDRLIEVPSLGLALSSLALPGLVCRLLLARIHHGQQLWPAISD
jgi:hypothetical protein